MATLFVQGEQGRHVDLKCASNSLHKGFGFHGELPDLVNHEHFAMMLGVIDRGQGHAIQFFDVDAVAEDAQA